MANVPNARIRDHRKVFGWLQIRNPRGNMGGASVTFSMIRVLAVVVAMVSINPDPDSLALALSETSLIG